MQPSGLFEKPTPRLERAELSYLVSNTNTAKRDFERHFQKLFTNWAGTRKVLYVKRGLYYFRVIERDTTTLQEY